MNRTFGIYVILSLALLFPACREQKPGEHISLIPLPAEMEARPGSFSLQPGTPLVYSNEELSATARYALSFLGLCGDGQQKPLLAKDTEGVRNAICLLLKSDYNEVLGDEGYRLTVEPDGISISANRPAGVFYGVQTLYQLMSTSVDGKLPCLEITDYPRFGYRGLHLDVSRHFMPVDFIYKYIDYMAMHKLNVFHWHLIDDQGWRLEIKSHPKLTETGAWRVDMSGLHWGLRPLVYDPDNATYGGYYTQDEIRAVVAYAAERNIHVMPEIAMPAHVMSALAAYPEYSCTGENLGVAPGAVWPITHIYCAGNDDTFAFLKDLLLETMELFPFEYIHVGGDEANKANWKTCPKCQMRISDEGLADEEELQSYFVRRIERFLNEHGRRLIGWDEILEGGLAPNATVMSWRGEQGGIEAARMGHNAVMTPTSHCYFDYYQGDPVLEPQAIGGHTTLSNVYSYEPIPEALNEEEAKRILGAQANVWTEHMPVPEQVEYMVFPRLAALSEVLWSPAEHRDWTSFWQRMDAQYMRYERLGINYSLSAFQVTVSPGVDPENRRLLLRLDSEVPDPEIRYTLDGSDPTSRSPLYTEHVAVDAPGTFKAAIFKDGRSMRQVLEREYNIHKAFAADVTLSYPNNPHYNGHGEYSLVNGIHGTRNPYDGNWKGFYGDDMVATIDLGKAIQINGMEVDALQSYYAYIFLPKQLRIEVSEDGTHFVLLDVLQHDVSPNDVEGVIHLFSTNKQAENVRYIRVHAENLGHCPPNHFAEGERAWLFVSEIAVY